MTNTKKKRNIRLIKRTEELNRFLSKNEEDINTSKKDTEVKRSDFGTYVSSCFVD